MKNVNKQYVRMELSLTLVHGYGMQYGKCQENTEV